MRARIVLEMPGGDEQELVEVLIDNESTDLTGTLTDALHKQDIVLQVGDIIRINQVDA